MIARNIPTTLGITMANILLSSIVVQHNPFLVYVPSCSGENSAYELSKKPITQQPMTSPIATLFVI